MEGGQTAQVQSEKWNVFAIVSASSGAAAFLMWPLMRWISPYPPDTGPLPRIDGTPIYEYYTAMATAAIVFALLAIIFLALAGARAGRRPRGTRVFGTSGAVLVLGALIALIFFDFVVNAGP